jgi:hypothetical protein
MIKKFEDFVLECYGNSVNEAFQSSKLREIIKQHGKPEDKWDNKKLYDIKDDNIVDVVDNRDEYYDKYLNDKEYKERSAYSAIPLKDGSIIVITGSINSYSKHKERHKGNLGKYGGDDTHEKHLKNVDKIKLKRYIEEFKKYKNDIVSVIEDIVDCYYSGDEGDFEVSDQGDVIDSTIKLGDIEYDLTLLFNNNLDVEVQENGRADVEFEHIVTTLKSFYISVDNDGYYEPLEIDNVDLDITEKTHENLFRTNDYEIPKKRW